MRWDRARAHVHVMWRNGYLHVPGVILRQMSRETHPHSPWLVHTEMRINGMHMCMCLHVGMHAAFACALLVHPWTFWDAVSC